MSMESVRMNRSGLLFQAQNRLFSNHEGVITLSNMTFISSTVVFDFEKTNEIVLKNIVFFLGSTGNAITFCTMISSIHCKNKRVSLTHLRLPELH